MSRKDVKQNFGNSIRIEEESKQIINVHPIPVEKKCAKKVKDYSKKEDRSPLPYQSKLLAQIEDNNIENETPCSLALKILKVRRNSKEGLQVKNMLNITDFNMSGDDSEESEDAYEHLARATEEESKHDDN